MTNVFEPMEGAAGFRLSNPSVLCVASLLASLDVFSKTSMKQLAERSNRLTGYLEMLIDKMVDPKRVVIISPRNSSERGCQLSLLFLQQDDMQPVFDFLDKNGVTVDERKPNVIRAAPAPLYNTYLDVYSFVTLLCKGLDSLKK